MENTDFKKVATAIMQRRNLHKITRFSYAVDERTVLQLVQAIGDELCYKGFTFDDDNRTIYQNCLNWLIGSPFQAIDPKTGKIVKGDERKGLFIAGNCGTGKSLLLTILAAMSSYYNIEYDFGTDHRKLIWKEWRADELCNQFILSGADVIVEAKKSNILCLNDIGSEPAEQMYMGNRVNIIRQILEARGDQSGQFTLITSNYPMLHEQIRQQYGDRVVSRLQGMCNYFVLKGKDRRNQ